MYEAYRVLKPFQWRGWSFAPRDTVEPEGNPKTWAGDIWIVEAGHPRKETMLSNRFATGDAGLPSVDELLKDPNYARLVGAPTFHIRPKKQKMPELVGGIKRVE